MGIVAAGSSASLHVQGQALGAKATGGWTRGLGGRLSKLAYEPAWNMPFFSKRPRGEPDCPPQVRTNLPPPNCLSPCPPTVTPVPRRRG